LSRRPSRRDDPAAWARELGISRDAVELYLASDVIDLHVDSFIWHRILGRDITHRHGKGLFGARFFGQADLPRLREAEIGGATWVITTNPLREGLDRTETVLRNVAALLATFARVPDEVLVAHTASDYERARESHKHAAFVGIQGGNAFDEDPDVLDRIPEHLLLRVTLLHLTSSHLGGTSSPLGFDAGIGRRGAEFVERLETRRIFVDLAHAGPRSFWDAMAVHDRRLPLLVTHTGVSGVHRHWRNLDDEQLRAVARTGGVVGIMYHAPFLGDRPWAGRVETIVRHLEHVRRVAGDDTPALGSDWDGAILTPRDMPTCLELPRLVECMLARGWSPEAVQKALGANFLRALRDMRG
jgi:membrane dipeptidase